MATWDIEVSFSVERGEEEVCLLVRGTASPVVPGRTFGPPERCYPDEGGDVEIVEIVLDAPGNAAWTGTLTREEEKRASEKLFEEAEEVWEQLRCDAAEARAEERAEDARDD